MTQYFIFTLVRFELYRRTMLTVECTLNKHLLYMFMSLNRCKGEYTGVLQVVPAA